MAQEPILKKRISIDIPKDVWDYLEQESMENTITIKSMCQKFIIDYVRNKKAEGKHLL
jgi:hypothetical protein